MAERDLSSRLRRAVMDNNLFMVKRLIQRVDMRNPDPANRRYTSLAWAAILGHTETFEFLLSAGHDDQEFSRDSDDNTILILLADSKPSVTSPHRLDPDRDVIGAALRMAVLYHERYPETLDWANSQGRTALHVAALKGNEDLVRTFCDLGADYDLPDNQGNTALHYASAWGHVPIVQLLIERGCSYTVRNNEGFNPSDYAYSFSTRDALQDTAREQFEYNRRARRNVFAQAAQRGNEWNGMPAPVPVQPRMRDFSGTTVRMRSGSGTSRTTNTSDSGDLPEHNGFNTLRPAGSQTSLSTTSSPSNPAQSLFNPTTSPHIGTSNLPKTSPGPPASSSSSLTFPNGAGPSHAALSPIASRMRENDAAAMDKYLQKTRNRSGSGETSSSDPRSHKDSTFSSISTSTANGDRNFSSAGPSANGDDITSLQSIYSAPRRALKTSASTSQLRTTPQPPSITTVTPADGTTPRTRSGTSPALSRSTNAIPPTSPPTAEWQTLASPVTTTPLRTPPASSDKQYTGPPRDYATFPEPPTTPMPPPKEKEKESLSSRLPSGRRLPFNLLSKPPSEGSGHRRGASATAVSVRGT